MGKWSIGLVSKSGNWGDWVVGQRGELADFSKSCKWSEVNKLGNHTVGNLCGLLSEGVGQRWESSKSDLLHKSGKRRVNSVGSI